MRYRIEVWNEMEASWQMLGSSYIRAGSHLEALETCLDVLKYIPDGHTIKSCGVWSARFRVRETGKKRKMIRGIPQDWEHFTYA